MTSSFDVDITNFLFENIRARIYFHNYTFDKRKVFDRFSFSYTYYTQSCFYTGDTFQRLLRKKMYDDEIKIRNRFYQYI